MSYRAIVSLLYSAVGIIFILGSIPFIRGLVGPNPYFGFRTAKTYSDIRIWYEANRAMGYDLMLAGAAIAVGAVVIYIWSGRMPEFPIAKANLFVFVISLSLAAAHAYWKLSRM